MSDEDLKAEVEKLRAENERLKTQRGRSVSLKVSEKGGVSVYGLGRFPVTLYKEQWAKLLAMADEIRAFLKEHDAELKAKAGSLNLRSGDHRGKPGDAKNVCSCLPVSVSGFSRTTRMRTRRT